MRGIRIGLTLVLLGCAAGGASAQGPYFATGIKIGEVDANSAIVWVRLTETPSRVGDEGPLPEVRYRDPATGELKQRRGRPNLTPVVEIADGKGIDDLEGAVPGREGRVRVRYRAEGAESWSDTGWHAVDPARDFTAQLHLASLQPGTAYEIAVEAEGSESAVEDGFRTAPGPDAIAPVTFAVITGTAYPDRDAGPEGFRVYSAIRDIDPDFFVHTGDILYYDELAKTKALARWHWARMYSLPSNRAFHRDVASYFIKDDHDTWMNDCWPGQQTRFMGDFTFQEGLEIFREQVPMGERTYRTFRWGADLQIWLVEGRDFRSANDAPDGAAKTIWGAEQKEWLRETMTASDATFRVLISPTPIVGPDRDSKADNHANRAFATEGREVRAFLASLPNTYVVCGDRHWQYVSVDEETGLKEFSSGPASDQHAGGWSQDDRRPEHRYLNVTGGFMSIAVSRDAGVPTLTARHFAVDGTLLNEDVNPAAD